MGLFIVCSPFSTFLNFSVARANHSSSLDDSLLHLRESRGEASFRPLGRHDTISRRSDLPNRGRTLRCNDLFDTFFRATPSIRNLIHQSRSRNCRLVFFLAQTRPPPLTSGNTFRRDFPPDCE